MPARPVRDRLTRRRDLSPQAKFRLRHPGYHARKSREWRARNRLHARLYRRRWRAGRGGGW